MKTSKSHMNIFIVSKHKRFIRKYTRYVKWSFLDKSAEVEIHTNHDPEEAFKEISVFTNTNIIILDADDYRMLEGMDKQVSRLKNELLVDFVIISVFSKATDIRSFQTSVEEHMVVRPVTFPKVSRILRSYAQLEPQKYAFNMANYIVAIILLTTLAAIIAVAWLMQNQMV